MSAALEKKLIGTLKQLEKLESDLRKRQMPETDPQRVRLLAEILKEQVPSLLPSTEKSR